MVELSRNLRALTGPGALFGSPPIAMPGDIVPGQTMPGQTMPGQMMPGQMITLVRGQPEAAWPASGRAAAELIMQDQAAMLYGNGVRGLIMTLIGSTLLVLMVMSPGCRWPLLMWLSVVIAILGVRGIDMLAWHPSRCAAPAMGDGRREMIYYASGCLLSGAAWAAFPLAIFPLIDPDTRITAAVVMAAIAGGSPMLLAPCLPLAMAYCIALVLPSTAYFLSQPGGENAFVGTLGLIALPAMMLAARNTHRSVLGTLQLSRTNQLLASQAEARRREAEAANRDLTAAQGALQQANDLLEKRIAERTADLAREISDRERYADALARMLSTDPLTELANRSAFVDTLAGMVRDAAAAGTSVAVLFIDLDKFKQVNDVRGHDTGDHLLRVVARLLREHAGPGMRVGRWGGDEFVVAVPDADGTDEALSLAWKLRRAFATPIQAGMDMLRIDATIGVATYPQDARTHDELIRAADVAMFEGKKEGGSRVKTFDPALARAVAERHMLEQALRDAIDNGDFSLVFQPIVSAETGRCEAFEALLRWAHPLLGSISPTVFIPVAEQTGLIGAIGRWVLREACRAAAAWPGDAPPVTVNVSVEQVLSGTLLADVHAALSDTGLPVHRLQLEITESLFVTDQARVTAVIEALRAAGVRILMDDFGSGYSSLACLSSLPLDVIKIDKSFVQGNNGEGNAFIQAILLIARSLHLRVIAEGIETEDQRAMLSGLGVELLQGYFFARPMAEREIAAWLAGEQLSKADARWPEDHARKFVTRPEAATRP